MLFELRSLLQNIVMGVPVVRRAAEAFHSTGLNGSARAAEDMFRFYGQWVSVSGKDVLELGPGQSPQVLQCAHRAGARRCVAVDTYLYEALADGRPAGIEVHRYDGIHLPFEDESFDVIWSSDVLEHVRSPQPLLQECARVLRAGGAFLARVDLRDHYYLGEEARWLECLKYPEPLWHAMTSNRSSFVNRVRASEWRAILERVGFTIEMMNLRRSALLAEAFSKGEIRSWAALTQEDAEVVTFDCVCRKAP